MPLSQQDIADALAGIRGQYQTSGDPNAEANSLRAMTQFIRQNNLDPSVVAGAANQIAPNGGWNTGRVMATMGQYGPQQGAGDAFGLPAAFNTLNWGGDRSVQRLNQTQGQVTDLFNRGRQDLQPYMQTGQASNDLQAALSGALGPQAQQQAYANYQQSPGAQFAQEQAEKAITRNASAIGGLGGGAVRSELGRNAVGNYLQDFNNYFQRLGQVGDRGFGAATQSAGFGPQEAAIQSNLGMAAANVPLQVAQGQSGMQFQTARDISSNINSVSTALSNLMNQQGAGTADMINNQGINLNALYQNAANGDAAAREQLAGLLGNFGSNASAQYSGVPGTPIASTNTMGQVGTLASGVAGLLSGLPQNQPPPPVTNYSPNYGSSPLLQGNGPLRNF